TTCDGRCNRLCGPYRSHPANASRLSPLFFFLSFFFSSALVFPGVNASDCGALAAAIKSNDVCKRLPVRGVEGGVRVRVVRRARVARVLADCLTCHSRLPPQLDDEGVAPLVTEVAKHRSLRYLSLENNNLSAAPFVAILSSTQCSLDALVLDGNPLRDD